MTFSTLLPAGVQRSRIGYCQKHASARFRPRIPTHRRQRRHVCTSGPVNYEWITAGTSDGSINRYCDPATGQLLSVDPMLAATGQPYAYTGATGYLFVGSDGGLYDYGTDGFYGSEGGQHLNAPIVGMAATLDAGGY